MSGLQVTNIRKPNKIDNPLKRTQNIVIIQNTTTFAQSARHNQVVKDKAESFHLRKPEEQIFPDPFHRQRNQNWLEKHPKTLLNNHIIQPKNQTIKSLLDNELLPTQKSTSKNNLSEDHLKNEVASDDSFTKISSSDTNKPSSNNSTSKSYIIDNSPISQTNLDDKIGKSNLQNPDVGNCVMGSNPKTNFPDNLPQFAKQISNLENQSNGKTKNSKMNIKNNSIESRYNIVRQKSDMSDTNKISHRTFSKTKDPGQTNKKINLSSKSEIILKEPLEGINPLLGPLVPKEEINLIPCQYCKRKFAEDRIEKHEEVCTKTWQKERNKYDAKKHRVINTEVESYSFKSKDDKFKSRRKSTTRSQPDKNSEKSLKFGDSRRVSPLKHTVNRKKAKL